MVAVPQGRVGIKRTRLSICSIVYAQGDTTQHPRGTHWTRKAEGEAIQRVSGRSPLYRSRPRPRPRSDTSHDTQSRLTSVTTAHSPAIAAYRALPMVDRSRYRSSLTGVLLSPILTSRADTNPARAKQTRKATAHDGPIGRSPNTFHTYISPHRSIRKIPSPVCNANAPSRPAGPVTFTAPKPHLHGQ